MDPVTHALVGATVGGLLTFRRYGCRPGLLAGGAALVPDLDVFLRSAEDPLFQLEMHRQFSHSLLFAPLAAGALAWLARRSVGRGLPWWPLYGALLLGYLSACLLDACTSYGTQLGWPVWTERVAWNLVPVVDPLFTVALLWGCALAYGRQRWGALLAAGATLGLYLLLAAVQHHRAERAAEAWLESRGLAPLHWSVKPTLGNLVLWRLTYRDAQRVGADGLWLGWPEVLVYPGESAPLWSSPAQDAGRDLARFAALSDGYLVAHPGEAGVVGDARYAMLPTRMEPLWGITTQDTPPRFVTFRDSSITTRRAFWQLLVGRGEPRQTLE